MKKIILLLILLSLLSINLRIANAETIDIVLFVGKVSAMVNGKTIPLDVPIIIDSQCNRTLVPLRFVSEAFGSKVNWIPSEKEVKIKLNDKSIRLFIGKKIAFVNNAKITLDCPPKILFSRTIVPIRFISEAFGANVKWFAKTKKIEITFEKSSNNASCKPIKINPNVASLIVKKVKISAAEKETITFYIAKINVRDKTVKILPFLSENGPKTRESYVSFINRVKPLVAINGGTFDLQTNTLTGDVVRNGVPQYIRYDGYEYTETMGLTKNNIPFFEDGAISYKTVIGKTIFDLKSVNNLPEHPYNAKVKLFTNWYKKQITAKSGQKIVIVKGWKVVKIADSLYPATLENSEWALIVDKHLQIKRGDTAKITITINGKDYSGSSFVRCGPLLIKNGEAYIDYAKYAYLSRTMKKGARSLLGIGKNGNFYFIYTPNPVRLNYGTLSVALKKCNLFNMVISLDGGGSTLFYYKGKYIARPGRSIVDIVAVPQEVCP